MESSFLLRFLFFASQCVECESTPLYTHEKFLFFGNGMRLGIISKGRKQEYLEILFRTKRVFAEIGTRGNPSLWQPRTEMGVGRQQKGN
jgi:hypothetical protein